MADTAVADLAVADLAVEEPAEGGVDNGSGALIMGLKANPCRNDTLRYELGA